jgi:acid ceramidase
MDNVWSMLKGYTGPTFAARYAMENFDNYEDAFNYLKNTKIVAPCYYIVGGVNGNEGSVITRAREYAVDIWPLSETTWWLVETNYDHWLQPTADDADRRKHAIDFIEAAGQGNMNTLNLFQLLSEYPNLRSTTVHTSVMVPSTGFLYTMQRNTTEVY